MTPAIRLGCFLLCALATGCSEKPADLTAQAPIPTTPAFESATGTIVVEVTGVPASRVFFEGPHGLSLELNSPAVACSMPAGIWSIRAEAPGHTGPEKKVDLGGDDILSMTIPLQAMPSSAPSPPKHDGLVVDGEPLSSRAPLRLTDFRQEGALRLDRTLAGKRLVSRRQFDGSDVASLKELQWKVRTTVIHAFKERTLSTRVKKLIDDRQGRHFLIAVDGQIHQLTDLMNKVPVLDPYQDRTTVHIDLQIPFESGSATAVVASGTINGQPTSMPSFSDAQHASLRNLLQELNRHLPRIHLRAPSMSNGSVSSDALAWPRLFRGVLARFHVDPSSVLPGPGLNFGLILPPTATRAKALGGSNEEALWIKGSSPHAKLVTTGPKGTKAIGTGSIVVCRPLQGQWRVESEPPEAPPWVTHVTVNPSPLTAVDLSKVPRGKLELKDSMKRRVQIAGPESFAQEIQLPATLNGLNRGTYRVSLTGSPAGQAWAIFVDENGGSTFTLPAPTPPRSAIIVAGQSFQLDDDVPLITFQSRQGHSFYRAQKEIGSRERLFEPRKKVLTKPITSLQGLKDAIPLVVLHADVLDDIETAFHVLHSKGLSSHFGIDFDGTIYQMLDPLHVAYGAAEVNPISIQIDLNNRMHNLVTNPNAPPYPLDHKRIRTMRQAQYKRPLSKETIINDKPRRAYGYTNAQYRSLATLMRTLAGAIEGLELDFPSTVLEGRHHWNDAYEDFRGIVAHYHLTPRRWDPGPGFDWPLLQKALRGHGL